MNDTPLVFALGLVVGAVFGVMTYRVCLAAREVAHHLLVAARTLYGWHRRRDEQRLAALEAETRALRSELLG